MTNLSAHYYLSLANAFVEDASLHSGHCKQVGTQGPGSQQNKGRRKPPKALLEINF